MEKENMKTTKPENVRKLVEALRSGRFIQGRDKLESKYSETLTKHCCLGVACRIAIENGLDLQVRESEFITGPTWFGGGEGNWPASTTSLPFEVSKWLGFTSGQDDEYDSDPVLLDEDGNETSAIRLNDVRRYTFDQIADAFERTYLND